MLTLVDYETFVEQGESGDEEDCDDTCPECDGDGGCECCGRDCLECGGEGVVDRSPSQIEMHRMYFAAIISAISDLCASSSRHDFLDEIGAVIKTIGRPGEARFYSHCQGFNRLYLETN